MIAPSLDVDLYAGDVLADSRELFARVREAGPVVWLPRHRMYAMGRFEDVRAALRDDDTFRSGRAVAANPLTSWLGRDTTLISDGDVHTTRRRVLMRSLGARAIAAVDETLSAEAQRVVGEFSGGAPFDAAGDFASRLPLRVVAALVGVPHGGEQLLRWAAATFQGLGPLNARTIRSAHRSLGLWWYAQRLHPGAVAPGSWAASVFAAHDAGELTLSEARTLVIDFVAPALDTTILATSHLVWTLGRHPDAWQAIRSDPSLIGAAVVEGVRLASPVRAFTRRLSRSHVVGGVVLPQGARVALLYGAANLDETQFTDPERFDLHRPAGAHVGWGNGPHTCVGIHLAKLEMRTLLEHLVEAVEQVIVGEPVWLRNNTLQGIAALPARFRPVRG